MCQPARAAIVKHYRLCGVNNRNQYSRIFGGWKSKLRCCQVGFWRGLSPWRADGLLLCSHVAFPLCTRREKSGISSSTYKDMGPIGLEPHLHDFMQS